MRDWKYRKDEDEDKPFWFESEQGILTHYAEEREMEAKAYSERIARLNKLENDMIEALRASRSEEK